MQATMALGKLCFCYLREENDINEQLIQAATDGTFEEVRRLIEIGADVNYGVRPPFLAAYLQRSSPKLKPVILISN